MSVETLDKIKDPGLRSSSVSTKIAEESPKLENQNVTLDPKKVDSISVDLKSPDFLVNKSLLHTSSHQRNDSSYSRNVSLIHMYEDSKLDEEVEDFINDLRPELDELNDFSSEEFHFVDLSHEHSKISKSIADLTDDISLNSNIAINSIKPVTKELIPSLLKSNFDIYGFKKSSNLHNFSKSTYNEWFTSYSIYLINRKKKWTDSLKSSGLTTTSPTRFPPKSVKIKKLVRRGIPPEYRGEAWFFYAGGHEKLNKHVGVYDEIVKDTANVSNKDTEVIERDLNRTFPDNKYFNSNINSGTDSTIDSNNSDNSTSETSMIKALRRVLVAFAQFQPQIGYCQSLNFIAGLLLLFMNEERAFWMLVILTERIIPKVHAANLEGVHTDQGVLMLCVKEYIPSLWSYLGKNFDGVTLSDDKILTRLPPVTLVTSSWFMSVFVGVLPIEVVLRVWDILWYEGSKTIFRISLTILNMSLEKEEFSKTTKVTNQNAGASEMEQIELFQYIQNYPKSLLNPNEVIDNCFKKIGGYGYGSLSQNEINNCREFVSKQRSKLNDKRSNTITTELTEEERRTLLDNLDNEDIHDVYGFHRGIMSGAVWNRNISNRMKMKFTRKLSR